MSDFTRPEVQVNTYRKTSPLEATVLDHKNLADTGFDSQVYHIRLSVPGYEFTEGQSAGVLPPGEDENGKPHNVRLYSIASIGTDAAEKDIMELCIKRVVYENEQGELVKGVCSNYLADLKPGDKVQLTGPSGRKFLLPVSEERARPYIFMATGTGIAPFRGFLQRLFGQDKMTSHPVHLFFGARHREDLVYNDEFEKLAAQYPNFHYHKAISREMKNAEGGRLYVHHLFHQMGEEMWNLLSDNSSLMYMCGLRGMEEGVVNTLKTMAAEKGQDSSAFLESFEPRFLKEVY